MIDFNQTQVLTFDCYGTLIDWESGILSAIKPILSAKGHNLAEENILQLFAKFESEIQQGEYLTYREVLKRVIMSLMREF